MMDIALPALRELAQILGPAGAIVALLVLTPAGRAWIASMLRPPAKSGETQLLRINGHPCTLHENMSAEIRQIRQDGETHHREQQAGIDRIHERIDELYRDMVRR